MEEHAKIKSEKKEEHKPTNTEANIESKEKKIAEKIEDKVEAKKEAEEKKKEKKKEIPKPEKSEISGPQKSKEKGFLRKEKAVVYGKDLGISKKHSMAICNFIKGKQPEQAIKELEQVVKLKKVIPMKGEIPHRKGMMSGRYPVNASKSFINLLKSLAGNCSVNKIENPVVTIAKADDASRPFKKGGMRFKRANVFLEAREKVEKREDKNKADKKEKVEANVKSKEDKQLTNKQHNKEA